MLPIGEKAFPIDHGMPPIDEKIFPIGHGILPIDVKKFQTIITMRVSYEKTKYPLKFQNTAENTRQHYLLLPLLGVNFMSKSNFIPASDHEFLIWLDHFIAHLTANHGVSEPDLAALKAATIDLHAKIAHSSEMVALAKQATADKNDSRRCAEILVREEVRRIKARSDYTEGQGAQLYR